MLRIFGMFRCCCELKCLYLAEHILARSLPYFKATMAASAKSSTRPFSAPAPMHSKLHLMASSICTVLLHATTELF